MHGSHCCECDRTTGTEATCSDGEIKSNKSCSHAIYDVWLLRLANRGSQDSLKLVLVSVLARKQNS